MFTNVSYKAHGYLCMHLLIFLRLISSHTQVCSLWRTFLIASVMLWTFWILHILMDRLYPSGYSSFLVSRSNKRQVLSFSPSACWDLINKPGIRTIIQVMGLWVETD